MSTATKTDSPWLIERAAEGVVAHTADLEDGYLDIVDYCLDGPKNSRRHYAAPYRRHHAHDQRAGGGVDTAYFIGTAGTGVCLHEIGSFGSFDQVTAYANKGNHRASFLPALGRGVAVSSLAIIGLGSNGALASADLASVSKHHGYELYAPRRTPTDTIVAELRTLEDGWSGDGTIKPTPTVIENISRFFASASIAPDALPDVEVDEDGYVSLVWLIEGARSLTANFSGRGFVVISYVDPDDFKCFAKAIPVTDHVQLAALVTKAGIEGILTVRA